MPASGFRGRAGIEAGAWTGTWQRQSGSRGQSATCRGPDADPPDRRAVPHAASGTALSKTIDIGTSAPLALHYVSETIATVPPVTDPGQCGKPEPSRVIAMKNGSSEHGQLCRD